MKRDETESEFGDLNTLLTAVFLTLSHDSV